MKYLSMQEAAGRLGVDRSTVWRWVKSETLAGEKIGGRWVVRESSVNRKLKQRKGSQ